MYRLSSRFCSRRTKWMFQVYGNPVPGLHNHNQENGNGIYHLRLQSSSSFFCFIPKSKVSPSVTIFVQNGMVVKDRKHSSTQLRLASGVGQPCSLHKWYSSSSYNKNETINGNHDDSGSNELCESTLLLQDGTDIQEVPLAVIRDSAENKWNGGTLPKPFIHLDPDEEAAFVEGFNNFHSPQEVLSILYTIPSQEVTPVVALSILRKLFELENNFVFRNDGKSWVITTENSSRETFARMAIVSRLIDILILGDDTSVLLDALDMLRYDRKSIAANVIRRLDRDEDEEPSPLTQTDILEFSKYRSKLCEQVLIRTTKGQLSLEQVCRAVCTMGQISQLFPGEIQKDFIDKMWMGISDKSHKIQEGNIVSVFRTIQYFQKSQRLVMSIVERKFLSIWWKMKTQAVSEICDLLLMKDSHKGYKYWGIVSSRLLASLSKCIHMNLHQLSEEELFKVIKAFHGLDFCDPAFEKTLSKYMKVKCLKISNPVTLSALMDYVRKFRIRSFHILEGAGEYLILHNSQGTGNLSPPQLASMLIAFGVLDYQPPHALKFWEIVERLLSEKFVQFQPKDIIDSLLSCVYLQKYPLNFVNRIFSPYFLDRLHTSETDSNALHHVRSNLKLLDTALTLECGPKYNGPFLPRDFTAKSVYVDGRILRAITSLQESLATIYSPSSYIIEPSVVLPNLPLNILYIVDILISPRTKNQNNEEAGGVGSLFPILVEERNHELIPPVPDLRNRFNLRKPDSNYYVPIRNGGYIAILINIPEHYASDGKTLLGPQVMRIRHLKLLGFNVVNLSQETLTMLKGTPEALKDYLSSQLNL